MAASERTEWGKLAFAVTGVVGTLMIYGVLQEKIMTIPYGVEGEKFSYSLFIVLCNRVLTCAVAAGVLLLRQQSLAPVAPVYKYAGVSLSNVVATTCQYEALKHVIFPVQTLAKCAKMIPVMIWGTAIMRKKYGYRDYLLAVTITAGCTIFLLAAQNTRHHKVVENSFYGITLMLGYLGFDGFTSTFQDLLFEGYQMEIFNQILYVTLCSSTISLLGLLSAGQLLLAVSFVLKYPACLFDIILMSLAATTSQFFISYTIRTFGALAFATIMTTRQLLSILLSCMWFGHGLSLGQWGGTAMVFGSLYYKTWTSSKRGSKGSDSGSTPKDPGKLKEGDLEPLAKSGKVEENDVEPPEKTPLLPAANV
eukprot:SM000071S21056  [mRNA]  locus=s71:155439:158818:- [translate_table: standard]